MDQISFVDYYEDLQISPNADLETIERVYRLLAKRYHPDNQATGSIEKFGRLFQNIPRLKKMKMINIYAALSFQCFTLKDARIHLKQGLVFGALSNYWVGPKRF